MYVFSWVQSNELLVASPFKFFQILIVDKRNEIMEIKMNFFFYDVQ